PKRSARPRQRGVAGGVAWIVVAGVLLAGIVALNVAVLRLNVKLDRLNTDREQLRGGNAALASQLSSAAASPRIENLAKLQLALGEQATTVYADPLQIGDPAKVAPVVARILRLDEQQVYRQLSDRSHGFVYIVRKADPARAARLAKRAITGIGFYPEERRFYPQHSIAAQVLGYAGVDNHGLAGLELTLDSRLAGHAGRQTLVRDPFGHVLDSVTSRTAVDGGDVYLTIDHTIQAQAESVLRETVQHWHARDASAIVLDPRTGGVLATAGAPTYDPNS